MSETDEQGEASGGCGCITLVIGVALAILLWQLWPEVTDFAERWLETH